MAGGSNSRYSLTRRAALPSIRAYGVVLVLACALFPSTAVAGTSGDGTTATRFVPALSAKAGGWHRLSQRLSLLSAKATTRLSVQAQAVAVSLPSAGAGSLLRHVVESLCTYG